MVGGVHSQLLCSEQRERSLGRGNPERERSSRARSFFSLPLEAIRPAAFQEDRLIGEIPTCAS